MPRYKRSNFSSDLISDRILREIKSFRPLRLFINKEKKRGKKISPFELRNKFHRLSPKNKAKYLQKAVDSYVQLLDEKDIDENVQVECNLFDYLLMKSEQKAYFQFISAPNKPPRNAVAYFSQDDSQNDEEKEGDWNQLGAQAKRRYRKMRQEARGEYSMQVQNFATNLPDRLQIDYLRYADQSLVKGQPAHSSVANGHDDENTSSSIRSRRKSLTTLPDSLKTTASIQSTAEATTPKLSKFQLQVLHQCMPHCLHYEESIPDKRKPSFSDVRSKNLFMRSAFNQLTPEEKLSYISKSVERWSEYLDSDPLIIEQQILTLHLLLIKNDDILLYFSSIGLPTRPAINRLVFFNRENDESGSRRSWSDVAEIERDQYGQRLLDLKRQYYEKLIEFIEETLPTDYMRQEFFRNVKYAAKDYELALRDPTLEKDAGAYNRTTNFIHRIAMRNNLKQFNRIKEKLLATTLDVEQRELLEELSGLVNTLITSKDGSSSFQ